MGPLILLHDLGFLQTLQQVFDQESLIDGASEEPKIDKMGIGKITEQIAFTSIMHAKLCLMSYN